MDQNPSDQVTPNNEKDILIENQKKDIFSLLEKIYSLENDLKIKIESLDQINKKHDDLELEYTEQKTLKTSELESKDKKIQELENLILEKNLDFEKFKLCKDEEIQMTLKNHEEVLKVKEMEIDQLKKENEENFEKFKKMKDEEQLALKNYEEALKAIEIEREQLNKEKMDDFDKFKKSKDEEIEAIRKNHEETSKLKENEITELQKNHNNNKNEHEEKVRQIQEFLDLSLLKEKDLLGQITQQKTVFQEEKDKIEAENIKLLCDFSSLSEEKTQAEKDWTKQLENLKISLEDSQKNTAEMEVLFSTIKSGNKEQEYLDQMKILNQELETIKEKNIGLNDEKIQLSEELKVILGKKEALEKENLQIIEEVSFQKKFKELEAEISEKEENFKKEQEKMLTEIKEKNFVVAELEETFGKLKTQNLSLDQEVINLKKELAEMIEKTQKIEESAQKTVLTNQNPATQANPNQKTITISLDELVKWDKKSKELMNQIKNLQIENSNLKIDLEEKVKLTNSIQVRQGLSLEGLEERCKALQNILDESSSIQQHMESKIKMLEQENFALKSDFESRENEIRKFRESAKDKFEIERKLNEKIQECENYFNKFRRLEEERKIYEEKNILIDNLQKEKSEVEKQFEEMKENYSTHQSRIKDLILNLNETKQSLHEIMSQKLKFQEEIENMNSETENLKREKDELKLEIEDLQSDKQIILKKSQNEIKDLKNAIVQEKAKYDVLLEDKNKLERDIKNLLDKRISQTMMLRKNSSDTDIKSTKQEKIILESLALRVEDLEKENMGLVEKLKKCEASIIQMGMEIEDKKAMIREIVTLTYETTPSLGEMMTKIEKDEKEQIYQVKKWTLEGMQTITEKTILDNFRLRKDLLTLGAELNEMIRKTSKPER